MATGTHKNDPLSWEQLLAYAEGRATPREQYELELRMAEDPLLEEAVEGMAMPGAVQGLERLERIHPGYGNNGIIIMVVALLLAAAGLGSSLLALKNADTMAQQRNAHTQTFLPVKDELPDIGDPLPAQDQGQEVQQEPDGVKANAASGQAEAFRRAPAEPTTLPVERIPPATRIHALPIEPETIRSNVQAPPVTMTKDRSNRQLHYLHDLKLIHPKEIYPKGPLLAGVDHVPASHPDRDSFRAGSREQRTMDYLSYMDEALGFFSRNDHKRCVAELRFLLEQYPDDVNALFYSGMSYFHLNDHSMARRQLHRVARHRVDVFQEEAEWYHALVLEKLGETPAARTEYVRIRDAGGFYADRARERLN